MSVKRHVTKLIVAMMLTVVSLVLLVGGTYAYFTLSTTPEISGASLTLGAKRSVKLAPDVSDGEGNHFPGEFKDSFSLKELQLGTLFPVSTADGIHWFLPKYQSLEEGGRLAAYVEDEQLAHANLSGESGGEGAYVFLDFWAVSPEDCKLRVSTSHMVGDPAGSFVIATPIAVETNGAVSIVEGNSPAAQCVRIGFLTESSQASEEALAAYRAQGGPTKYKTIVGLFQEKGEDAAYAEGKTAFCVYEPNADRHQDQSLNGVVLLTDPLVSANGATGTLQDRLTVQLETRWRHLETDFSGSFSSLEEAERLIQSAEVMDALPQRLEAGRFLVSTERLYQMAGAQGVPVNTLEAQDLTSGGTEDVIICTLRENVPQRIRMYIWLEGQDADCTDGASAQDLLIHLELAGQPLS